MEEVTQRFRRCLPITLQTAEADLAKVLLILRLGTLQPENAFTKVKQEGILERNSQNPSY
jgi:hypothetical protein